MFRVITIEREYGCGGARIAAQLADHLGWKLWDHLLTEEIARLAHVDPSAVKRCDERRDSRLYRLARGLSVAVAHQAADFFRSRGIKKYVEGRRIFAQKKRPAASHHHRVPFLPNSIHDLPEDQVDSVDRERAAYIKHYFDADWPARSLYHLMLNTAVGDEAVIQTILSTMRTVEGSPKATDYEAPQIPASS